MKTLGMPLLLLLVAISAIGPMTLNGVLPATTTIMVELSTRFEVAQMILTVFLAANLISQLILGPAADRYGRRPVMLFGLAVFFMGSVACATAQSIEWLLLARFVQGVGGAVCVFLPRTVVRDVFSQNKAASVIGYMTTAMMVAPLFAPALGGWITDTYSWRYMFVGLAGLSTILLIMCYRYQYETLADKAALDQQSVERPTFFSSSKELLRHRSFIACAIMQAGAVGVYYAFLAGAPYVAMEIRGMSASSYGLWFAMIATGYLSGNLVAGRFSESQGVYRMVWLGAWPFALGTILFWFGIASHHPISLFVPMFLITFSNGVALPSMFSIAMSVRPELVASASGLSGSLQTALGVFLTLLVGYLLPFDERWLYIVITASTILSLIGLTLTLRIQRQATMPTSS